MQRLRLALVHLAALAAIAAIPLGGCTFSSTADRWHDRVGPDGKPVYVKTHTNIGFNLLIVIPVLGRTSIPTEIDKLTDEIAEEKGDTVRMVESSTENLWYGFAPVTWVVTPVITTVSAEYRPDPVVLARDRAWQKKEEEEEKK